MKFGLGNWYMIADAECLPGKTLAQMNLQAQRMLGQQSTAEFQGLHIDVLEVGRNNSRKEGVKRKNGFIVNTGRKKDREELRRLWEHNKATLQKSQAEIDAIVLPRPVTTAKLIETKQLALNEVRQKLKVVQEMIKKRKIELWKEGRVSKGDLEAQEWQNEFPDGVTVRKSGRCGWLKFENEISGLQPLQIKDEEEDEPGGDEQANGNGDAAGVDPRKLATAMATVDPLDTPPLAAIEAMDLSTSSKPPSNSTAPSAPAKKSSKKSKSRSSAGVSFPMDIDEEVLRVMQEEGYFDEGVPDVQPISSGSSDEDYAPTASTKRGRGRGRGRRVFTGANRGTGKPTGRPRGRPKGSGKKNKATTG